MTDSTGKRLEIAIKELVYVHCTYTHLYVTLKGIKVHMDTYVIQRNRLCYSMTNRIGDIHVRLERTIL